MSSEDTSVVDVALARLVAERFLTSRELEQGKPALATPGETAARLDDLAAAGAAYVVASCRLANLSPINETYGYEVGDLLQALLARVAWAVRPASVFVGRAAGSQTVFVFGPESRPETEQVLDRLRSALTAAKIVALGGSARARPVIGVVEVAAGCRVGSTEVLRLLHDTRRRAAEQPDGMLWLRPGSEQGEVLARLAARQSQARFVSDALERGEVEVHFQPVIDVVEGRVYDLEALARIRCGEALLVASEFIGTVHDLGLTTSLDVRVIDQVARQVEAISRVSRRVLVNVSPLSLGDPDLMRAVRELQSRFVAEGVDLTLMLELTEQALVENVGLVRSLHAELGVSFAVDDFGSGYSSLRVVTDLAIERVISLLKVDGSIIRRLPSSPEAVKVVLSIGQLARSLGLEAVAEHVENPTILSKVRTAGIRLCQGHVLSRPLAIDELVRWAVGRSPMTGPPFDRRRLQALEPYLDKAIGRFYDTLLSNPHFAGFFADEDQVLRLVERQKASFLEALEEDDDALARRYVELGRLHHRIGIPFPTFQKGASILSGELVEVLADVSPDGALVRATLEFFQRLESYMARGYLERHSAEDRRLLETLDGGGEHALLPCFLPVLDAVAGGPGPLRLVAAGQCPGRGAVAAAGGEAPRLHAALHTTGESLAFFVEREDWAHALLVYRRMYGTFVTLAGFTSSWRSAPPLSMDDAR